MLGLSEVITFILSSVLGLVDPPGMDVKINSECIFKPKVRDRSFPGSKWELWKQGDRKWKNKWASVSPFEMEMMLNSIRAKHKCTDMQENIGSHGKPNKSRVTGERQGVGMEGATRFMLNS